MALILCSVALVEFVLFQLLLFCAQLQFLLILCSVAAVVDFVHFFVVDFVP